jgi:hypothetical protein
MHHHSRNRLRGRSWRRQGNACKQRNSVSRARCVDPEDTRCLCGRREGFSLRGRCRNRHARSSGHLSGQVTLLVQVPQIAHFAVELLFSCTPGHYERPRKEAKSLCHLRALPFGRQALRRSVASATLLRFGPGSSFLVLPSVLCRVAEPRSMVEVFMMFQCQTVSARMRYTSRPEPSSALQSEISHTPFDRACSGARYARVEGLFYTEWSDRPCLAR